MTLGASEHSHPNALMVAAPMLKACFASKEPKKEKAIAVPVDGDFSSWLEDEVGMCEAHGCTN